MKALSSTLLSKLGQLKDKHDALQAQLREPQEPKQLIELSKELAKIDTVVTLYSEYTENLQERDNVLEMGNDPQMESLIQDELKSLEKTNDRLIQEILMALIPDDPDDNKNVFLEIRAGTGGEEAALFAQNLLDMYLRFAERHKWQRETIQLTDTGAGGIKEAVILLTGKNVYAHLKFESGVHRVQRVPKTESQGRIHTSACTVAILPEVSDVTAVDINPSELRIDTFRSSGAGGQHVNTTDSAVRITHIPSGVVVECQDERSQHKNKAKAMKLLNSKILQHEIEQQHQDQAEKRKVQVGSGDRSERIRTYNFPQGRITDHRINLTLYKLNEVLAGDLEELIEALTVENRARLMAEWESK